MAHLGSIVITLIIHLVFRFSFFIKFQNVGNNLSVLPSIAILVSICMILHDTKLIPERYSRNGSSATVNIILETIICLFIVEMLMSMVWSRIEVTMAFLLKLAMGNIYEKWTTTVINLIISGLAGIFTGYVATVTNNVEPIRNLIGMLKGKITKLFQRQAAQCNPTPDCTYSMNSDAAPTCSINIRTNSIALPATPDSCPVRSNGSGDRSRSRPQSKKETRRCWKFCCLK